MRRILAIALMSVMLVTCASCTGELPTELPSKHPLMHGTLLLSHDPENPAVRWLQSHPNAKIARSIRLRIAHKPMAKWFDGTSRSITASVKNYVASAAQVNQMPIIVASKWQEGTSCSTSVTPSETKSSYRIWIRNFAAGIGVDPAIVIVEPGSLAYMECLSPAVRRGRIAALRAAVDTLVRHCPNVEVFLDGGDAGVVPPDVMARRLRQVGVVRTSGFAANVGGYVATEKAARYGALLRADLKDLTGRGDYYEIIDTSRNGRGGTPDACNPPEAGLGEWSRISGGVDDPEKLWITVPGTSDGSCGVAPHSSKGEFVPALAQRLIENSH